MGKAIPTQHPAVVLRSHYRQLRALLAVAMIAVVGLTAAVVILATNDDRDTSAGSATQVSAPGPAEHPLRRPRGRHPRRRPGPAAERPLRRRPRGGNCRAHRALGAGAVLTPIRSTSPPGVRYDGGPEEGTRGALPSDAPSNAVPGTRYDGGPEEGSRGTGH